MNGARVRVLGTRSLVNSPGYPYASTMSGEEALGAEVEAVVLDGHLRHLPPLQSLIRVLLKTSLGA